MSFNMEPLQIVIFLLMQVPAAFLALGMHEQVKAWCSTKLGDPTPKNHGLLTNNYFKFIEPIGFILTVIMGFGWGRPTPTSPLYYKDRKKGILITYLTPSLVNLLFGLLGAVSVAMLNRFASPYIHGAHPTFILGFGWVLRFLFTLARINIGVALFNMIPVPPLDAAKLLQMVLSPNAAIKMTQNEKVLQVILMFLIVFGIITRVINPVINFMMGLALVF